jgi:hypothetical protein
MINQSFVVLFIGYRIMLRKTVDYSVFEFLIVDIYENAL